MCLGLFLVLAAVAAVFSSSRSSHLSLFSLWRAQSWVLRIPADLRDLVKHHYVWVSPLSDQREGKTNTARKQAAK